MNIFEEISTLEFFMINNVYNCREAERYQKIIKHLENFKNEKLFYYKNYDENNIPDFDYNENVVAEFLNEKIDNLNNIDIEVIDDKIAELKEDISVLMNSPEYNSLKKLESYKSTALLGGTIQDEKEIKRHLYKTKKELNSFLLNDSTMRPLLGGAIDSMFSQSQKINFTVDDESFDNSINSLVQNSEISKKEASLYELLYELCILDSSLITESLKQQQSLEIEEINKLENEDEITPDEARNRRVEIVKKYNNLKSERMGSFNNNLSINQSKSNQVNSMIDAMVNGTMDVNGQPINNMDNNANTRTMGFTAPMLIGLITGICTMGLVIIGIILIV